VRRAISRRNLLPIGKLVHGGLRYLEYYEFRLVREAIEREVLLRAAPHII
jgi:glycerol-3-phosphate dehydrogenase